MPALWAFISSKFKFPRYIFARAVPYFWGRPRAYAKILVAPRAGLAATKVKLGGMMDICSGLTVLGTCLVIVAVVGHALWMLAAGLLRALSNGSPPLPADRRSCPRCGTTFARRLRSCPECDPAPDDAEDRALRRLDIASQQIRALAQDGFLDEAVADQAIHSIATRQADLLPILAEDVKVPPTVAEEALRDSVPPLEPVAISIPVVAGTPPVPQRTWGEMMAGFMEESNILWGELVGGLLIVGCSIALVISLWQTLAEIPYFPFLIFAAITGGLFSAGLYSLSHWKLEATSRGLLMIATLLTPLDFLVLAGLTRGRGDLLDVVTELASVLLFAALVWSSGRILLGTRHAPSQGEPGFAHGPWLMTLAVIGASATQLLVPHLLADFPPSPSVFMVLSLTPGILQVIVFAMMLISLLGQQSLHGSQVNKLLLLLGCTMFAVVVALGFIVYWSAGPAWALGHLAVPITVAAWPLLFVGAAIELGFVPRLLQPTPETGDANAEIHGLAPAVARLIGTSLAMVGAGIMLTTEVLAWPRPIPMMVIGALNAAVMAGIALWPTTKGKVQLYAHVPALAFLTVSFLTAFHGVRGEFTGDEAALGRHMTELLTSPATGQALTILTALLALASEIFRSRDRAGKHCFTWPPAALQASQPFF